MIGRIMRRRVEAAEKRLGIGREPLAALSDLDLLEAIRMLNEHMAEEGSTTAMSALAEYDAQEAALRAFWASLDATAEQQPILEPGVRWPYLRARARHDEAAAGRNEPRSAASEVEFWRKIVAAGCLQSQPC